MFLSRNTLRVYLTRNFGQLTTPGSASADLATLQKLLRARPFSVSSSSETGSLPEYPCRHAAHAFELHIHYVDAPWGSGIGYMTLFTQDGSNHADNDELQYIFQGVSKDGSLYISTDFHLTHPRLDHWGGPDAGKGDYRTDCKLLSSLTGNSFTPKLPEIYEWLKSLKFQ